MHVRHGLPRRRAILRIPKGEEVGVVGFMANYIQVVFLYYVACSCLNPMLSRLLLPANDTQPHFQYPTWMAYVMDVAPKCGSIFLPISCAVVLRG